MKLLIDRFIVICLLVIFVFSGISLFAQEAEKGKGMKMYFNANAEVVEVPSITYPDWAHTRRVDFNTGYFTPAFAFYLASGNFHEIELSTLEINSTELVKGAYRATGYGGETEYYYGIIGERVTRLAIQLRLEHSFLLNKKAERARLKPYLGLGLSPFMSSKRFRPFYSDLFPVSSADLGISVYIIPRINYSFGEKFFLDVNAPFDLAELTWSYIRVEHPLWSPSEQRYSEVETIVAPQRYLLRVGLGLKI